MTNVAGRVLWIVLLLVAPGEIDGRQPPSRTAPGAPLKGGASGEQIYQAACLTCHGADGAGSPQSVVGFDTPLPDFTDCAFATGEPDPDWYAVVHEGGPVRALGKHMPAFGEALSPDEIGLALGHIRTFCSEPAWPRGDLNLPRAFFTEKAYPENEAVWATTVTSGEVGAIENQLIYERRFGARNQLEVVAPIGFAKDAAGQWQRGLGDVALAFKRTLHASMRTGSIGSAGVEVILPTGKEQAGLGNGYTLFEPFAMWGQILPADFYLQFHGGLELPTDSSRGAKEGYVRYHLRRGPWLRSCLVASG